MPAKPRKSASKTDSRPSRFRVWWVYALALGLSLPLALAIQALRQPDRLPPEIPGAIQRPLAPLFAKALTSPQASTLTLSVDEINAHLAQALPPEQRGSEPWALQRLGVRLESSRCEVLTQQLWRGHSIHLGATYAVSLKGGKFRMQLLSGHVGRLALSASTMRWFERPLLRVVPLLRRERVLLDRLDDLKLTPERATLYVRLSAGASSTP
jgi:hypothetical protein